MKILNTACAATLACALATPTYACSICRCGDPTFNALGKEGISQTGWRLAMDWDQTEKSQGNPAIASEEMQEQRMSLLFAYGLSERVNLYARIPWSTRELSGTVGDADDHVHHTHEHQTASGLADPEIYGQARLWSSALEGDVGVRSSLFAVFGVKTPWGENDESHDGERLDEHVQPGTGSTDWFAGLSGSYQINPESVLFASAQYRLTGRNDAGYQYGRIALLNLAYEHKISSRWDAVVEANYRHAGYDEMDSSGAQDPDTGGSMIYITPRLLFSAGGGWVIRAAAQIPVTQSGLNGYQEEHTVLNVGLTKLFQD